MQPTYNIDNPNLPYQIKHDLWQTAFGLSAGRWFKAVGLYGGIG